jgi:hypothetical protein
MTEEEIRPFVVQMKYGRSSTKLISGNNELIKALFDG